MTAWVNRALRGFDRILVRVAVSILLAIDVARFIPELNGVSLYDPKRWLGQMNPAVRLATSAAFDWNLKSGRLNTRPGGATGKFEHGVDALPYQATQLSPQTKALFDLFADPVKRYDTGAPIVQRGKLIPLNDGQPSRLLGELGFPVAQQRDMTQVLANQAASDRRKKAAADKLTRNRLRAGA